MTDKYGMNETEGRINTISVCRVYALQRCLGVVIDAGFGGNRQTFTNLNIVLCRRSLTHWRCGILETGFVWCLSMGMSSHVRVEQIGLDASTVWISDLQY